jgi:hypothetical protein
MRLQENKSEGALREEVRGKQRQKRKQEEKKRLKGTTRKHDKR